MKGDFTIMQRDLYYYIFENNQERYEEVLTLLKEMEDYKNIEDKKMKKYKRC